MVAVQEQEENMRWLGYFISNNLKWEYHIAQYITKVMRTGYNLKALRSRYQMGGLDTWTTLRLIKGLIILQITYGIEVWKKKTTIREAQTVLNNIIHKAYGLETKLHSRRFTVNWAFPHSPYTPNTGNDCLR